MEIIPCVFSHHNVMKLEVNHKQKFEKITNTWMLNNMLLNSETNQPGSKKGNKNNIGQWTKVIWMQEKRS